MYAVNVDMNRVAGTENVRRAVSGTHLKSKSGRQYPLLRLFVHHMLRVQVFHLLHLICQPL